MAFTFKQFHIADDQCAMKVGTDSIMLGSWSCINQQHQQVLDIGTGSGLLAIMLAQKSTTSTQIIACEFSPQAAIQARFNVDNSPWSKKIEVVNCPIQQLEHTDFDLIISNPPYFSAGQTFDYSRQVARHTAELTWPTLLDEVSCRLKAQGCFECVIPNDNAGVMIELAQARGLNLLTTLLIKTKPDKKAKRVLLRFVKTTERCDCTQATINIYNDNAQYTEQFKTLCREYYLNF